VTQLSDYAAAFGLRDNPFSPNAFGEVDDRVLDDISSDPLRLDDEPGLLPLFVPGAGPFQSRLDLFEGLLQAKGYAPADSSRRKKSMTFRVIGPEGSGKSTLTNRLVGRLRDCVADVLVVKASAKQGLDAVINEVRERAKGHGESCCCVVIDDVQLDFAAQLNELYGELRETAPVVMFEIIHHAQDLSSPRRVTAGGLAEDLETTWLTPDHAAAFVAARIDLFRVSSVPAGLIDDHALFPFDAEEIRSAVSPGDPAAGTLTLRTLSWVLGRGLDHELIRRRGERPIAELEADELGERIISVERAYAEALATPAGGGL
jgi:energy-coupling factor transporter ATP-binding protein EcfA2